MMHKCYPISEAPKDGRQIILVGVNTIGAVTNIGLYRWVGPQETTFDINAQGCVSTNLSGWWQDDHGKGPDWTPTHYMLAQFNILGDMEDNVCKSYWTRRQIQEAAIGYESLRRVLVKACYHFYFRGVRLYTDEQYDRYMQKLRTYEGGGLVNIHPMSPSQNRQPKMIPSYPAWAHRANSYFDPERWESFIVNSKKERVYLG